MKNINDFKFSLNVSREGYENKKEALACLSSAGAKAVGKEKMAFKERKITVDEFLTYATEGHSFCNLFNYDPEKTYWMTNRSGVSYSMSPEYKVGANKGYMKVCFKSDEFFKSSQVIFLDIDYTKFSDVKDYIEALTYKPTCVYMSYSDGIFKKDANQINNPLYTEEGIKSRRFRMVYVFEDQLGKEELNMISYTLNKQIEKDTQEEIEDKCGVKVSQYFNGCFGNKETYKSDLIYSYFDFIDLIPNNFEETEKSFDELDLSNIMKVEKRVDEKKLITPKLVNDMTLLPYDEFMKHNRHKYQYIYRVESNNWIEDKYQFTDENYFSLYYNISIVKDGEHRRKKLFERICLRRVMNPSIDPDTLLFDAYEDVHRYFDNTDGALSVSCLVKNIESAFKYTVEEIEEKYSNNISYLKSKRPAIILKKGVAFDIADRNAKLKEVRYSLIDEAYNTELSINENLEYINKEVFKLSKATLYRYCKERNINTSKSKDLEEAEIMGLYDFGISIRKNLENIKKEGIKISFGKLQKLVKNYSEEPVVEEQKVEVKPVEEKETTTTDPLLLELGISQFESPKKDIHGRTKITVDPLLAELGLSENSNDVKIDYSIFKPDFSSYEFTI